MQSVAKVALQYREGVEQMRRSQQRRKVSTHGVEGDKAHIQQAGKADHDIKAQGEHDIEQRKVDHPHPVVAACGRGQPRGEQQPGNQQKDANVEARFGAAFRS